MALEPHRPGVDVLGLGHEQADVIQAALARLAGLRVDRVQGQVVGAAGHVELSLARPPLDGVAQDLAVELLHDRKVVDEQRDVPDALGGRGLAHEANVARRRARCSPPALGAGAVLLGRAQLALDGLDVGAHLGVGGAQVLDLAHAADDGRVIAVAERAAELGEAALEALLAQVHGHVPRERDALVPVLRQQVGGAQLEVVADHALDVLDARLGGARRRGRGDLGPGERDVDGAAHGARPWPPGE